MDNIENLKAELLEIQDNFDMGLYDKERYTNEVIDACCKFNNIILTNYFTEFTNGIKSYDELTYDNVKYLLDNVETYF